MIYLIWIAVLIAVIFLFYRQSYTRFSDGEVKHFKPHPFVGNTLRLMFRLDDIGTDLDKTYNSFPNERFIGRYEFAKPIILLRDLDLVKKVGVKDFEHFIDHRNFVDDKIDPLFGRNLIALKGQEWKDMRSTLSPAFTSSKIKLMVPFMIEVGDQMVRALKKKIQESKNGAIDVDCKDLTSRYANDVIASCAFGLKVDSHTDENNQFYEMGKTATSFKFKQLFMFMVIAASPGLAKKMKLTLFTNKVRDFFINLVLNTMNDREERNIIRPDMIHLLMEAKKGRLTHDDKVGDHSRDVGFAGVEESAVGKKLTDREWTDNDLVAQAVLFFMAGFETISTAMSFALHELAVHPDVQDRLYKEIKEYNEKHKDNLGFTTIQNMTYMDMVVSEVLRLWPPALALDRQCVKDYNLGKPNSEATKDYTMKLGLQQYSNNIFGPVIRKGCQLLEHHGRCFRYRSLVDIRLEGPKMLSLHSVQGEVKHLARPAIIRNGEILAIPVWCFHRDPQYFPDPMKFDPERFSDENKHKINPMAYMPFGVGPRNCVGSRFALCELKFLIFQILLHYEVSPSEKTRLPAKLSPEFINPRLLGGHWLKFKPRA